MGMLVVHHRVQDYDAWRPVFDNHVRAQLAAGLTHPRVLRSADDPNAITVIFDDMDTGKAKAFAASKELKETMMRAGVVGTPEVHFLETT
jgi:hypothetical protein